jgi:hypothetical protein
MSQIQMCSYANGVYFKLMIDVFSRDWRIGQLSITEKEIEVGIPGSVVSADGMKCRIWVGQFVKITESDGMPPSWNEMIYVEHFLRFKAMMSMFVHRNTQFLLGESGGPRQAKPILYHTRDTYRVWWRLCHVWGLDTRCGLKGLTKWKNQITSIESQQWKNRKQRKTKRRETHLTRRLGHHWWGWEWEQYIPVYWSIISSLKLWTKWGTYSSYSQARE